MGALAIVSSFTLGIKTAGDVTPFSPSEASDTQVAGDMNSDGIVNVQDAIEILEIVRGYKEPTTAQLLADPNNDGRLTIDDAIRILHDLSIR
jgi:hypothetical protein